MTQTPPISAEHVEAAARAICWQGIQGYGWRMHSHGEKYDYVDRNWNQHVDAAIAALTAAASIPASRGVETPKRWLIEEHLPSGAIRWQVVEHEHHANEIAAETEFPTHTVVTPLYAAAPDPQPAQDIAQCCMCGKTGLSTIEGDGGTECQLDDGRWTCSQSCWERAVAGLMAAQDIEPVQKLAEDAEAYKAAMTTYLERAMSAELALSQARNKAEAAEEAENEAKDCFWAIYPEYLRLGGKSVSTEAARTALAARAEAAEKCIDTVWLDPSIPPATPKGTERYFIVAVRRDHNGKVWTFPAQYLNAYPLLFEVCECEAEHSEDGCPSTGWYSASSDGEYDENYSPLLSPGDELVAWAEVPLHPADARNALVTP